MTDKYKEESLQALGAIVSSLPKNSSEDLKSLTWQFYSKLPLVDLEVLEPKEAAAIAEAGYEFIKARTPGVPKIEITHHRRRFILEILNDDMPFLVDSVTAELNRLGVGIVRIVHPIIRLLRDAKGNLKSIAKTDDFDSKFTQESLIRVEISNLPEHVTEEKLAVEFERVLRLVRHSVQDWKAMNDKITASIKTLTIAPAGFKQDEVTEVKDFLTWLLERNFVFLGYIEYDFFDSKGKQSLKVVKDSELGIFRDEDSELKPKGLEGLPPEVLHFALVPQLMEITKSMRKSAVHRPALMDYIGIKRFDAKGNVIGECRFLGLFTSSVYYQSTETIPFIRRKIKRVLAQTGFDLASHDGKSVKAILEFTPRDELFQLSEDDLFSYALGVLSLELQPGVRLFVRRDAFERFVSCIVFVPRDRFSTSLREELQGILARGFHGCVMAFYTQMTESQLARLHVIISTTPGQIPAVKNSELEGQIARVTHRWADALQTALSQRVGEEAADSLLPVFATAFTKSYIADHDPSAAVYDIQKISGVIQSRTAALEFFRNRDDAPNIVHLKWYNPEGRIPLSDVLPLLENMGFRVIDEQPYPVHPAHPEMKLVWIRDFTLTADEKLIADINPIKEHLEELLARIWQNDAESDTLDALVLNAHITAREVMLLRAYTKYLRQVNFPYDLGTIASTLKRFPAITSLLVAYFHARFEPKSKIDIESVTAGIENQIATLSNLTDDRILRRFYEIINATLRTNYYQVDAKGSPKSYLSFKFDSSKVPELPLPRPYAEIFVYSTRVEGIHLRGGKVARGGLRWSDRRDDFRTEVLALMKAQMVKNAVIVPVGSKGGFVLKKPPALRDGLMEEGIACYKTFLSGLLDITDNIVKSKVVPPANVVRHDDDDPYLVVAADKGTATFSDIANSVSADYGFWLGDAFASGGSVGYDHKKMAITARGGFISVERHFREMGIDIHAQDFSVVGIGDMAGDVFGNGMLLSKHIKLVGAFNHMHIFLDPNPDAAVSFRERSRLFSLPRSTWKDYDEKLISKGGGVYERSAKSIAISPEMQKVLATDKKSMSPDELIKTLLLAPVDLLWNGGIGTYVKAEEETHEQAGDRGNNAVRINGKELRCKVVGEGGNLGFTQKGRVEYARNGGRINTDAIDNSAGVDCSDHEVNIKIGLGASVASGKLSIEKRDAFLASMTEEVAQGVLKDNRLQTQALTIAEAHAYNSLDSHIRLMHNFEQRKVLDRAVEFLPTDKQLNERRTEYKGLTRPELAVLLAYSKMVLYPELLASDLPDDPYFQADLVRYFPAPMQKEFAKEIASHQLRREIIATMVTNSIVNRTGSSLIHSIAEDTGASLADVSRAYIAARDAFSLREVWHNIELLDGKVAPTVQADLFMRVTQFAEQSIAWLLHNLPQPINVGDVIKGMEKNIAEFRSHYDTMVTPAIAQGIKDQVAQLTAQNVPHGLAQDIAWLVVLASAYDVVQVSRDSKRKIDEVATLYFQLGEMLELHWLRREAAASTVTGHWDRLAVQSLIISLFDAQRRLTSAVLASGSVDAWRKTDEKDIARFMAFVADLKASEALTLPKLVIASQKVEEVGR